MPLPPRLTREAKTISAMVEIYCRNNHDFPKGTICESCHEFLEYARKRLSNCPFQEQKPTCGKCTVHCYKKEMQLRARKIMRHSGPRMILTHPLMAFLHLLDGKKRVPDRRCSRQAKKNQPKNNRGTQK
jgi:hypothetical protein